VWHHKTTDSPLPLVTNLVTPLGCDVIYGRPHSRFSQKQNEFIDEFTVVHQTNNRQVQAVMNNLKFIILDYLAAKNSDFRLTQISALTLCGRWCPAGRNEVRWRPGQEASLAPPCLSLSSFGSKFTVLKKVLATFLGLLGSDSEPWESRQPLVTPLMPSRRLTEYDTLRDNAVQTHIQH